MDDADLLILLTTTIIDAYHESQGRSSSSFEYEPDSGKPQESLTSVNANVRPGQRNVGSAERACELSKKPVGAVEVFTH